MDYDIDFDVAEKNGCSSKIVIADRIFYVKLFSSGPTRFFSGDQQGVIQKEISKVEFELWINILADNNAEAETILRKLDAGKKF